MTAINVLAAAIVCKLALTAFLLTIGQKPIRSLLNAISATTVMTDLHVPPLAPPVG